MIRHIVMFSCKDAADRGAIHEGLSLLTAIPDALRVEVAVNEKVDQIANEIDVVVYAEFETVEALRAYKAHPLYEESIRRVRPLRDMRVAADYDTARAATSALTEVSIPTVTG